MVVFIAVAAFLWYSIPSGGSSGSDASSGSSNHSSDEVARTAGFIKVSDQSPGFGSLDYHYTPTEYFGLGSDLTNLSDPSQLTYLDQLPVDAAQVLRRRQLVARGLPDESLFQNLAIARAGGNEQWSSLNEFERQRNLDHIVQSLDSAGAQLPKNLGTQFTSSCQLVYSFDRHRFELAGYGSSPCIESKMPNGDSCYVCLWRSASGWMGTDFGFPMDSDKAEQIRNTLLPEPSSKIQIRFRGEVFGIVPFYSGRSDAVSMTEPHLVIVANSAELLDQSGGVVVSTNAPDNLQLMATLIRK